MIFKLCFNLHILKLLFYIFKKIHTFQIASLLVFALVFSRIDVICFLKKIMYFVYISTYLGNMLVIE